MTDKQLPEPLVPSEVDLRGMEFMPLYGDRLIKSNTWIAATAEAKIAALRLWWHAFAHEVPAASLPDSDQLLAEYAGYGVAIKVWQKIRPQAMRGWVRCSDGRWYHRMVADLALAAWERRVKERDKKRRWRDQKDRDGTGTGTGTSRGSPPGQNRDVPRESTVESERESKRTGRGTEKAAALTTVAGETGSAPGNGSAFAAAAKGLIYPEKLSSAQVEEARTLLNGNPRAQLFLDELAGLIATKGSSNPLGFLVSCIERDAIGKFAPSHAHRVQAEREGHQVRQEVQAAGRAA